MLNVMRLGWPEASKCGIKPVGGQSINAGEEVADLMFLETQDLEGSRWGGFTVSGRPLAGGCAQDSGK